MSKSWKEFLYFSYSFIISLTLYRDQNQSGGDYLNLMIWYMRFFFPVCVFIGYRYYISKETDNLNENLGSILFLLSVPALFFSIGLAFFLPFIWISRQYVRLGVPVSWSFYLSLITPLVLVGCLGWFYNSFKKK